MTSSVDCSKSTPPWGRVSYRIYTNACYRELQLRGLEVDLQKAYQVIYRGRPIGKIHFGHLLVEGSVFVFPVAIQDIPLAILANFYDTSLKPIALRV